MAFYNSNSDGSNFVISFTSNPKQDFHVFAKGYARAASVVAEHLLEKDHFSDYEAYRVVFRYRHALELYLKGLYYRARLISCFRDVQSIECDGVFRHGLKTLADTFKKICETVFSSDHELVQFASKAYQCAIEFEQIDKDSFGYRYPIDKKGNPSTRHHQVVNLLALHDSMNKLLDGFDIVAFGFDMEASQAQEIYEILQEAQSIIADENGEAS